ncbi:hypothetical protein ES288_D03G039100v1 [Gossypium darwinii]|uniref:Uncharacterized protein n=1 Tax=Gossypium darwinii TaxID=34276 RepID=A0A5D2D3M5_GOSDA|nr:hypothetical protein ES288_D03G039100v1 [Gossypium darwinii]
MIFLSSPFMGFFIRYPCGCTNKEMASYGHLADIKRSCVDFLSQVVIWTGSQDM